MYIITSLKNEFPHLSKELDVYDQWLRRYYDEDTLYKIFDSEKDNYHYLQEAYRNFDTNKGLYNKNMAWYSKTLNDDDDFLTHFIDKFFNIDAREMAKSDKKALIESKFNEK